MVGRFIRGILVVVALLIFAGIGLLVFLSDPDIRDLEMRAKYALPPSQFITLPSGATVHFRDQGQRNGPAIVLLHGSNASLHTWEPWVAQIGDQFRMVSLDLPSHGLTGAVPGDDYSQEAMAQFVNEFTTVMHIERFTLVGHSMGGDVAARFALHFPERLTHLVHFPFQPLDAVLRLHQSVFLHEGGLGEAVFCLRIAHEQIADQAVRVRVHGGKLRNGGGNGAGGPGLWGRSAAHPFHILGDDVLLFSGHGHRGGPPVRPIGNDVARGDASSSMT